MKLYLILIVTILLSSIVNSYTINTDKTIYYNQETIMGYISLDGVYDKNINLKSFSLYDQNNSKQTMSLSLIKLDSSNYYYYFTMPKSLEGNYTLKLSNLLLLQNNGYSYVNITTNFSIVNTNFSIAIDPGIFLIDSINTKNLFRLVIINNFGNNNITISHDSFVVLSKENFNLTNNNIYNVNLLFDRNYQYKEGVNGFITLKYYNTEYKIPVYIKDAPSISQSNLSLNLTQNNTNNNSLQTARLESINEQNSINLSFYYNETKSGWLKFKNTGDFMIQEIDASLDGNLDQIIRIDASNFSNLDLNNEITENVYINEQQNASVGDYQGSLFLTYESQSLTFPIFVHIIGNDSSQIIPIEENQTQINQSNIPETPVTKNNNNILWILLGILSIVVIVFVLLIWRKNKGKKGNEDKFDQVITKYLKKQN
jgi:hypothetical protein